MRNSPTAPVRGQVLEQAAATGRCEIVELGPRPWIAVPVTEQIGLHVLHGTWHIHDLVPVGT